MIFQRRQKTILWGKGLKRVICLTKKFCGDYLHKLSAIAHHFIDNLFKGRLDVVDSICTCWLIQGLRTPWPWVYK